MLHGAEHFNDPEVPQLTAKYFGDVPVIGLNRHPESDIPEERTDWMIMFPSEYTRENLTRVCEEILPPLAQCSYISYPESGLSMVTAYAKEMEMHMTFSMRPVGATFVELDGPTRAFGYGSMRKSAVGVFPYDPVPWNLDRIDSRKGYDGQYIGGMG